VLGGVSLFGGTGSAIGAIFGALMFRTIGDLLFVFDLDPLWQPLFQGVVLLAAVCHRLARLFQMRNRSTCSDERLFRCPQAIRRPVAAVDPPVATAFGCIVAAAARLAASIPRAFLSPEYLLQQLKVASFLGVIATGMMLVILLGQIDLSVPWVVTVGGMMSTAATAGGRRAKRLAIPFGVLCGVALRPDQRFRRRLSAHSVDDLHARSTRSRRG
jgi:ribose transport system permease protein